MHNLSDILFLMFYMQCLYSCMHCYSYTEFVVTLSFIITPLLSHTNQILFLFILFKFSSTQFQDFEVELSSDSCSESDVSSNLLALLFCQQDNNNSICLQEEYKAMIGYISEALELPDQTGENIIHVIMISNFYFFHQQMHH